MENFMFKKILFTLLLLFGCSQVAVAGEYEIDPAHSSVGFKIRHLAISTVPGTFTAFKGTFSFDPDKIEKSSAEAEIAVTSVNTNNEKRDNHLKGEDFFDVEKFKVMKFKSKKVEKVDDDSFKVHGDLTIRGITKPVVLDVDYLGMAKDPWGSEKAGFTATTTINRKDFGLTWNKVLETGGFVVGDDVNIRLDVEGTKKS